MNCLKRRMPAVLLLAALCLLTAPLALAGGESAPHLTSLEAQVDYLVKALSDSLRTMDWKMAVMTADGFKAAGLTGKDLEIAILRAERDAALQNTFGATLPQQIAVLGQAIRVKVGDAAAHETLKHWAFAELPVVAPPDYKLAATKSAEFIAAQRAFQEYLQAASRKDMALLGLALLNEPGVAEKAVAALKTVDPASRQNSFNATPLILAALLPDPKAGIKTLIEFCSDDKAPFGVQSSVVAAAIQLAPNPKGYKAPDAAFSVQGEVQAQLPVDMLGQLSKPYVGLLKRWVPPDASKGFDYSWNTLCNAGYSFPPKTFDAEGIAAIQNTRDKATGPMAQMIQQQFNQLLTMQGVDPRLAQKPPAPPKDF